MKNPCSVSDIYFYEAHDRDKITETVAKSML